MTDSIDQAILTHGAKGWASVKPLLEKQKRSTLYRHLKRLAGSGLIEKRGPDYRTNEAGLLSLAPPARDGADAFDAAWPPINEAPSDVHRALVELVLSAVIDRWYSKRTDHYPSFTMCGRTLLWKSWTGQFICSALGLDPVTHVVLTTAESRRSIFVRRGQAGSTVSERGLLNAPFAVFDEVHKADEAFRRLLSIYLQGSKSVAFENDTLGVHAVSLVLMNPREGRTLSEKTGYDDAQIRRMVIADLDGVTIGRETATRGEEILSRARKHPPLRIDSFPPREDGRRWREDVMHLIEKSVDSKWVHLVDIEMILGLVSGMSAFLAGEVAVRRTITDYLTVVGTLGWARPGWPAVVGTWRAGTVTPGQKQEPEDTVPPHDLQMQVKDVLSRSETEAPSFDYGENLRSLKEVLEEEGVTVDDARGWIARQRALDERLGLDEDETELLSDELERVGGAHGGKEVVRLLGRHGTLSAAVVRKTAERDALALEVSALRTTRHTQKRAIMEMGGTVEGTKALMRFKREIEWRTRISAYSTIHYLTPAVTLQKTGMEPEQILWMINELSQDGGDPAATVRRLTLIQGEHERIGLAIEEYRKRGVETFDAAEFQIWRMKNLIKHNQEWKDRLTGLQARVGECEEELKRKREESTALASAEAAKRKEIDALEERRAKEDEAFRAAEQFLHFLETGEFSAQDEALFGALAWIVRRWREGDRQTADEARRTADFLADQIVEMLARWSTGRIVPVPRETFKEMKAVVDWVMTIAAGVRERMSKDLQASPERDQATSQEAKVPNEPS